MAERSDYLYAQVRKKVLDAVRMDLIGPTAAEEALTELPTNSYITGMLELVITAPETFRIKTKKTRDVVENLIKNAEKSVVMTGYSISDYFTGMLDTIIAKSQQGVYVRFYVNDIEKSRASLVKMLAYRSKYLQFFEYEKNSDDKMAASHAKILTIDSDKSLVSSANLSYHGLSGNIEMGFLVRSADKAKQIEELLKELVRMHVYKKIS